MPTTKKICLFWHNLNSTNYGVSALAISHLNLIVEVARKNNIVMQIETWGTPAQGSLHIQADIEKRLGMKIVHYNYGLRYIYNQIKTLNLSNINPYKNKEYDVVFDIGEGDSFADIYGLKRFLIFSLNKFFAIKAQVPLVIAPQTIGPFTHKLTGKIARYLMRKSNAVYVRDHKSSDYLTQINVKHKAVSDVAFLLPYDTQPIKSNTVGLNVSGLLWHGGYTKNNQFNLSVDYQRFILSIVRGLIARDKTVYLVGHVISDTDEIEDDYRTLMNIKEMYFQNETMVKVAPKFEGPIQAKSFISSLTFFAGSRMHATIGAVSAGVPTIPLAYSRKFSGVFESLDYPHTIELYGCDTRESLLKAFFEKFDHQLADMAQQAQKASHKGKEQLVPYQAYIQELIT